MSYDNTNSGALFGNFDSNEPKEDNRPNFRGPINIDGVDYEITGWVKYGKDGGKLSGKKFASLRVELKEPKQPKPAAPKQSGGYDWDAAARDTKVPEKVPPITGNEFLDDEDLPF